MSCNEQFFGIVRNGEFQVFAPEHLEGTTINLTSTSIEESQSPENGIIDLSNYEGKIIEVSGRDSGQWIYSAKVEEEVGPVLSGFLKKVFLKDEVQQKRCVLVIDYEKQYPGFINKKNKLSEVEFYNQLYKLIEKKVQYTAVYKVQRNSYTELPDDINELDPDFIISLNCNTQNKKTSGTEVLYYQKSEAGKKIAEIVLEHLAAHLNLPNRDIKAEKSKNEAGLIFRYTTAPYVIVKSFFMDNNNDVNRALEDMDGLADAFARAIDEISNKVNFEHRSLDSEVLI